MATTVLMILMINYLQFHHLATPSSSSSSSSSGGGGSRANVFATAAAAAQELPQTSQVDRLPLEWRLTAAAKSLDPPSSSPSDHRDHHQRAGLKLRNDPPNLVSELQKEEEEDEEGDDDEVKRKQTRSEIPKVVKQSNTRRTTSKVNLNNIEEEEEEDGEEEKEKEDLGNLGTLLYTDLTIQRPGDELQTTDPQAAAAAAASASTQLKPIDIVKHHHHKYKHHHHHHHHHYHHPRNRRDDQDPDQNGGSQQRQQQSSGGSADRSKRPQQRRHKRHPPTSAFFGDRPVVETRKGLVRGITQKLFTGKFVDAFLGIPYAKPPLGEYRFRHPQPVQTWAGELDASRMSNSCYQINDTFFGANFLGTSIWNANTPLSEDCLYLNIWSPFGVANTTLVPPPSASASSQSQTSSSSQSSSSYYYQQQQQQQRRSQQSATATASTAAKTKLRPVMVWIFGGGFYSGTSSLTLYEGGVLASEEDIIVVSMNYRVAALGFLYFGRPDAPGNAGLFDQLMALQWINDNIDQFGGDPNRVTIFGESAGAVSVAFHLLSPLSRNLFSQAILQSGAATCPWGYKHSGEIIANGLQLASLLNCPSSESNLTAVVDCLLHADPMAMVSQDVGQSKTILNFPFVPVVDGSFLVESPEESLLKSNFKRANILLGSNNDEGNSFLIYLPEFSNCPSMSSPSSSSSSTSVAAASSQLNNGGDDDDNNNNNNNDPSNAGAQQQQSQQEESNGGQYHLAAGTNFKQQPPPPPPLESLDLRLASGPQQRSSSDMVAAAPRAEALVQQQQANDAPANGAPDFSEQATNNNDSNNNNNNQKPCTPNEYLQLSREDFLRVLREELNPYAVHPVGKEAIVFEYSNWNNPQDAVSNYDALDKIVGDYYFTCHVNEFAQRYAAAGNAVYMYYFKQRSSMSPWPKWMGVLHADEINFVFGEPLNQNYNYTAKEIELSRRMMKYWANFAKFGNPTKLGENASMGEKWPKYSDKKQYFELHSDSQRIGRGPRAKQCAFWANYLPNLLVSFDRNQCPAHMDDPHRPFPIHPFNRSSSLAPVNLANYGYGYGGYADTTTTTTSTLSNVPSSLLISLSVLSMLIIIALLFVYYAKFQWKLMIPFFSSSDSSSASNNNEVTTTNNNNNNNRNRNSD